MYDHTRYPQVSQRILDSLDRYAQEGVPTGGFLEAVLSNNLMESFGSADSGNRAVMFSICEYVYNEIDGACHGSPKRVAEHLAKKHEERTKARNAL